MYNFNYWQFGDYLGIGVGVYGKVSDIVIGQVYWCWKVKLLCFYMEVVGGIGWIGGSGVVDVVELLFEYMFNVLWLIDGVLMGDFVVCIGFDFECLKVLLQDVCCCGWLIDDVS